MSAKFVTIKDIVKDIGRGPNGDFVVFLRDYFHNTQCLPPRPLVKVDVDFLNTITQSLGTDGAEFADYLRNLRWSLAPGEELYLVPVWETD